MRRLACLVPVLALGAAAPEQPDVRVQQFADPQPGSIGLRGEVRYSLGRGDVTAVLSYLPTSRTLTFRVEHHTAPMGLAEQGSLLEPLLARFLQERFTVLLTDHAELVAGSPRPCVAWDGPTGRPVRGALG